jgi:DNA-binding NarL/FixJ family response regulator
MIRILVAEDHHLVREGICKLLHAASDLQVVGEAADGLEALHLTQALRPDVVVLDVVMPQMDGLESLKRIKALKPSPQVVILSMHGDWITVQQALQNGAVGYVLKQSVGDELIAAVRAASRGSVYLSAGVAPVVMQNLVTKQPTTPLDRLSPREREIVELIVAGCSTREIAELLHTSIKTVEKQRRDAMRKLQVDNVASLVRVSLELGISKQGKSTESTKENAKIHSGN